VAADTAPPVVAAALPAEPVGQLTAPVSFAQERLWTLEQIEPGNPANNLRAAFRVQGVVDPDRLERALNQVVARHEALRTVYAAVRARPVQVILESMPLDLERVDLRAVGAASQDAELQASITTAIQAPFDLALPPLVRVLLLSTADDEHVLLFVAHHIECDGWSLGVMISELLALYAGAAAGAEIELAPLPLQYRDFATWQRDFLSGDTYTELVRYWTRQLEHAPAMLPLPTDRPRPRLQTYGGSAQTRRLSPAVVDALGRLGRSERSTLFMVLLAGFATLLSRYADRDDVVVGTPIANRRRAEDEKLIGFFVNTLVMRVDLDGDPTFRTLLQRVRELTLDAYDHQDMPFEKVVEELNPPRSASHSPFFQVMFILQNMPIPSMDVGGLHCEPLDVRSGTSRFDLTLFAWRGSDGLDLVAEYNRDLFDDATIARMLDHFERLLAGVLDDPDRPVSRLPLGGEVELLATPALPDLAGGPSPGIHQLFEQQARRTPESVALRSRDGDLSYGELNRRANVLARRLVASGVEPGQPVGLALERSPELVVGLLAILKAGGAYVPLGPEQPASRLEHLLRDSGLRLVVTRTQAASEWTARGVSAITVDDVDSASDPDMEADPTVGVDGGSVAYVMYTSGSTGEPRGVVGLHRGAVNRIEWMGRAYPFGSDEICCQKTALSFVDSVAEIFGPLLLGVPQVLVGDEDVRDPRRLLQVLGDEGVTRLVLVPSLLRALLAEEPDLGARLPRLRLWVTSGETLTPDLRDDFYRAAPDATLLNLYGSTEVSADVLWHDTRTDVAGSQVAIGRPIDNTSVHLLDRHLQPVPVGVPGEIHIAGAGLAQGYHGRPELTTDRFVSSPRGDGSVARLYRTGDLGRRTADGTVHFLGRRDRQVKVRGYRVELGEIEAALGAHPALETAAVVADDALSGDRRLIAYVVAASSPEPTPAELRAYVSERLPSYMVPATFVSMAALPLTTSGKVDRRRLPTPTHGVAGPDSAEPSTELEWQLHGIWSRCLGGRDIGVHDDFFEVGGHSLLALAVTQEAEALVGRPLPLVTLFEAPTIAQLAVVMRDSGWQPRWHSLVPIRTSGEKSPFFVVPGIRGLALNLKDLARYLDPDRPLYGLQSRGLAREQVHTRIEDMAQAYLDEIRTVQDHGPYVIGGVCFGARVAFEMARQLDAAGEEVAQVVLVEAYAPGVLGLRSRLRRLRSRVVRVTAAARPLDRRSRVELVRNEVRRGGRTRNALIDDSAAPLHLAIASVRRANMKASRAYAPPPYPGPVTVFRGDDFPEFGWDKFALGGVDLQDITGFHAKVLEMPHVRTLGRALNAALDRSGV